MTENYHTTGSDIALPTQDIMGSLKGEHRRLRETVQPAIDRMREVEEEMTQAALGIKAGDMIVCSLGKRHRVVRCWAEYTEGTAFEVCMLAEEITVSGRPSARGPLRLYRQWRKE